MGCMVLADGPGYNYMTDRGQPEGHLDGANYVNENGMQEFVPSAEKIVPDPGVHPTRRLHYHWPDQSTKIGDLAPFIGEFIGTRGPFGEVLDQALDAAGFDTSFRIHHRYEPNYSMIDGLSDSGGARFSYIPHRCAPFAIARRFVRNL